jgi:hypothetical protein
VIKNSKWNHDDQNKRNLRYQLIFGIRPGQCSLQFLKGKKIQFKKILHFLDDSVHFESSSWYRSVFRNISLYESSLFSEVKNEVELRQEDVYNYSFAYQPRKKNFHSFENMRFDQRSPSRTYLELNHGRYKFFAGMGKNKNLILPQEDMLDLLFQKFDFNPEESKCVLQVNIQSRTQGQKDVQQHGIEDVVYDTPWSSGKIWDEYYLTQRGEWVDAPVSDLQSIFFVGDETRPIALKIKYENGNSDYLTTFCSQGSYLVEQL